MFARWGRFVYRRRWLMLAGPAILLGLSVGGIVSGGTLAGNGNFGAQLPAGVASRLVQNEMSGNQGSSGSGGSEMTLPFGSPTLVATDADFKSALEQSLTPLQSDSRVASVITPYTVPALDAPNLMSRDKHKAPSVATP